MSRYPYIADLSKADARVLVSTARRCQRILEYGTGGSTLLFAQAMVAADGRFVSVDTDPTWIHVTQKKLVDLGDRIVVHPEFQQLNEPLDFDDIELVFVDGHDDHRRGFAINAWPRLTLGGVMMFHDTRRLRDIQNVNAIVERYFEEVSGLAVNTQGSNMTLVYKRVVPAIYENWNDVEGKPPWMCGLAEPPADWVESTTSVET
jgi:predicted O-methyltransferase YrrM